MSVLVYFSSKALFLIFPVLVQVRGVYWQESAKIIQITIQR